MIPRSIKAARRASAALAPVVAVPLVATAPKGKATAADLAQFLHDALAGRVAEFLALAERSGAMRLGTVLKDIERIERAGPL